MLGVGYCWSWMDTVLSIDLSSWQGELEWNHISLYSQVIVEFGMRIRVMRAAGLGR